MNSIVIVDFKMGNLLSIKKAIEKTGFECLISSNLKIIENATKIIIPGVGHFKSAMNNIKSLNLLEPLNYVAKIRKVPVLGICLGMQLMANQSEEGNSAGLGWVDGEVQRFKIENPEVYKIPNIGWNRVSPINVKDPIFFSQSNAAEFYFVHSYHFVPKKSEIIIAYSTYEESFVSMIRSENFLGMQFHPEKSHEAGRQLLYNFLSQ
jgi:glutamine amidotransferase